MPGPSVDAGGLDYDQVNTQVRHRLTALRLEAPAAVVDEIQHWVYRLVAVAYSEGFSDGVFFSRPRDDRDD